MLVRFQLGAPNISLYIGRSMLKVSRILNATVFYHGRNLTRPYTGKYIFLTADPAYASLYSGGQDLQIYELNIPEAKIFSLRKADNLTQLAKATSSNPQIMKSITDASLQGEMDWAAYSNIATEEHEDAESLLKSLGFHGIWLNERPGVNSVLLFDQHDAKLVGTNPPVYKKPE